MIDWLADLIAPDPEPMWSWRGAAVLILLAAIVAFFAFPFLDCPCGGPPPVKTAAEASERLVPYLLGPCRACDGKGRRTLYACWFREPAKASRVLPEGS